MAQPSLEQMLAGVRPRSLDGLVPLFESMNWFQKWKMRRWEKKMGWDNPKRLGHAYDARIICTYQKMLQLLGRA